MLTYDVDIWGIRQRKGRTKPYELRWRTGARPHSKSFRTKEQADGRRAELLIALRNRQQFDIDTGLPAFELADLEMPTWYQHACTYALMKWPKSSAKHRASIAEALRIVTPVLVSSDRGVPDPGLARRALRDWAFRIVRNDRGELLARKDVETPPDDIAVALAWFARNSLKVNEAVRPRNLRPALDALCLKLDGATAADNTIRRRYNVVSNALRYAIELEFLAANPLSKVDWEPPKTDDEIDFRYVPDPELSRELIDAVGKLGPRGEHLKTFFGGIYYAGTRPGEGAALKETDFVLPEEEEDGTQPWGEVLVSESHAEVGSAWTDGGKPHDERGLKHRARNAVRSVPIPPVYVRMVREHIRVHGTAPDGRLFRAAGGGRVRSTEYCDLWGQAREMVLSPEDVKTPLAEVPYSLRLAGISLWIKAGVDPVEAARRAGHSFAVLSRFYAKILRGAQRVANALIDRALAGQR
ncbi:site-specific integrase [Streptomyces sp. UNOB3_S3]|uniref:tyrosine-type recombinase/integrase n=1 Tax=Streptomyces sp. UNOB3_S3 TaxID=2871682 RepID=UPI001E4B43D4|nr:site-specific integrase [Streptomyces sp. UNOB3_S3]MCC3777799.1 site-specific integrase [Streptomyces sp. UNOB3_S3]